MSMSIKHRSLKKNICVKKYELCIFNALLGVDKFWSKLNRNITKKVCDIIHTILQSTGFLLMLLFSVKKFNINLKIGENGKKEVYNCGVV